jgi:acetyltransferase
MMHVICKDEDRMTGVDMTETFSTSAGVTVTIRPLLPNEGDRLLEFGRHLSPDARYHRFHVSLDMTNSEQIQRLLAQLLDVDQVDRIALVATTTDEAGREVFVAVARAHRVPGEEEAEAAVVVRDDYQNQGLGLYMLQRLVDAAQRAGFARLRGYIQPNNTHMFHLLQKMDLAYAIQLGHGEATVVVFLQPEPVLA